MREGQYTVYAVTSLDKKEVEAMQKHLEQLGEHMEIVKDGRLHRLQFGKPVIKRHHAQKKLDILTRAGIKTAHMLLS